MDSFAYIYESTWILIYTHTLKVLLLFGRMQIWRRFGSLQVIPDDSWQATTNTSALTENLELARPAHND